MSEQPDGGAERPQGQPERAAPATITAVTGVPRTMPQEVAPPRVELVFSNTPAID